MKPYRDLTLAGENFLSLKLIPKASPPTMNMYMHVCNRVKRVRDLHDEHVLFVRALLCQVTHVANQSSLSTACLTHDHNRNATPDEGGRKGGEGGGGERAQEYKGYVKTCTGVIEIMSHLDLHTCTIPDSPPESHLDGKHLDEVVYSQHVGRVWVHYPLQPHHCGYLGDHHILTPKEKNDIARYTYCL